MRFGVVVFVFRLFIFSGKAGFHLGLRFVAALECVASTLTCRFFKFHFKLSLLWLVMLAGTTSFVVNIYFIIYRWLWISFEIIINMNLSLCIWRVKCNNNFYPLQTCDEEKAFIQVYCLSTAEQCSIIRISTTFNYIMHINFQILTVSLSLLRT